MTSKRRINNAMNSTNCHLLFDCVMGGGPTRTRVPFFFQEAGVNQVIDPRNSKFITSTILKDGMVFLEEMKDSIKTFVTNDLGLNPAHDNSRFNPPDNVRNIIIIELFSL